MSKQLMLQEIMSKLNQMGISHSEGQGTDITISCEFLDAGWGTGNKKISYNSTAFLDEGSQTIFMWELTTESGSGISFGGGNESSFQSGTTLFRKVKSVQYGFDGKAYEYTLDLGAIPKAFKETAKAYGWKFKTVLSRHKAMYPQGYVQYQSQSYATNAAPPPPQNQVNSGVVPPPPPDHENFRAVPPPPPPGTYNVQQNASQPISNVQSGNSVPPPPPQQQYNNPQGSFYSQGKTAKKGSAGVLFWVLFSVLVLFDLLLVIGGSGTLFFAASAVLFVSVFFLRKKISESTFKTILGFLVVLVAIFVIFAVTGNR